MSQGDPEVVDWELPEDVWEILEAAARRRGFAGEAKAFRDDKPFVISREAFDRLTAQAQRLGVSPQEAVIALIRKKLVE